VRVRGTIEKLDGNTLTVKSRDELIPPTKFFVVQLRHVRRLECDELLFAESMTIASVSEAGDRHRATQTEKIGVDA
jgi:hypothetical protein